jgi:minor histocompatibility antigen H13
MGLITASIIFIGAHQSLKLNETDEITGKRADGDRVSQKDALMFPVFGSIALMSLYICYKYIGKEYMNLLLTTYVMLAGVAAVADVISLLVSYPFPNSWREKNHLIHFNIPTLLRRLADGQSEFRLHFGKVDIVTHLIGLALAVYFLQTKDFTVHNLFGFSFAIQAVKLISLGQFQNGFILLWGLFVYDCWWVFGTGWLIGGKSIMESVALNFEAPAKIIFPQSFEPWKQGILGLGDIVIPGLFISLCIRFDDFLHCRSKGNPNHRPKIAVLNPFPRVYFYTVMIGYLLGLVATAVAMKLMNTAQPALLYLVPGTTIPVACLAIIRKEFRLMLQYSEEDQVEKTAGASAVDKKAETKKSK